MTELPQIPVPDIINTDGLSHIAAYVDRLFASKKSAAVLMLSNLEGQAAFTILVMGGNAHFNLMAYWDIASPTEKTARNCFARLQVDANEKENNGQRIVNFVITGSPQRVTNAATAVMTEIYGVEKHEGLKFRFDEWSL